MIYGDRTAFQTYNSDFNFLHVRELLNTIEVRCKAILDDYIFTYNNAATRAEIITRLDPILKSMKDSGALAKYEIQVDEINNTKEVIDQKVCIVDIGVWVTPNMEKIITRLTVNRGSEA
jgi:phage tail sheath protein FI